MSDSATDRSSVEPPLPETELLTLEEYLDMQGALGNVTRYRLVRTLVHSGPLSASELGDALDVAGNNLHYHLDTLVDVGLVDHRKKNSPDSDGLFSYYRATPMAEIVLEEGVEELMRREVELLEDYR